MRLTPTEEERLRIFTAAELARSTLARGHRLNAPEAVALVCDEMHMAARGGASHEEVAAAGRSAVSPGQVLDGVASIVPEIASVSTILLLLTLLAIATVALVLRRSGQSSEEVAKTMTVGG